MGEVRVTLFQASLWAQFRQHTTEMIVTKTGRKIFPKLEIEVTGMLPHAEYGIQMQLERADQLKYRYSQSAWTASVDDDNVCFPLPLPIESNEGFSQPGELWMKKGPIEFSNFKVTNNQEEKGSRMLLVQTLHKYVPVIYVYEMGLGGVARRVAVERLSMAEFITVTAYQNEAIKKLKVVHNPFAKGCRGSQAQSIRERSGTTGPKRSFSPSPRTVSNYRSEFDDGGPPPAKLASPAFPACAQMPLTPGYMGGPPSIEPASQMASPAYSMAPQFPATVTPYHPFPSPPQEKTPTVSPQLQQQQPLIDFASFGGMPMMESMLPGYGMMLPYAAPFFSAMPHMDYSGMFAPQHASPYMFSGLPDLQQLQLQPPQQPEPGAADADTVTVQSL